MRKKTDETKEARKAALLQRMRQGPEESAEDKALRRERTQEFLTHVNLMRRLSEGLGLNRPELDAFLELVDLTQKALADIEAEESKELN